MPLSIKQEMTNNDAFNKGILAVKNILDKNHQLSKEQNKKRNFQVAIHAMARKNKNFAEHVAKTLEFLDRANLFQLNDAQLYFSTIIYAIHAMIEDDSLNILVNALKVNNGLFALDIFEAINILVKSHILTQKSVEAITFNGGKHALIFAFTLKKLTDAHSIEGATAIRELFTAMTEYNGMLSENICVAMNILDKLDMLTPTNVSLTVKALTKNNGAFAESVLTMLSINFEILLQENFLHELNGNKKEFQQMINAIIDKPKKKQKQVTFSPDNLSMTIFHKPVSPSPEALISPHTSPKSIRWVSF